MKHSETWATSNQHIGRTIHVYDCVESTNTLALELAEGDNSDGLVVVAKVQTAGRGQHGRFWLSPPGTSVLMSVILLPPSFLCRASVLTGLAAVSVCEALEELVELSATIKWPNDILVDGKKLAGILTEACCDSDRVHYVILGIGVNLNYRLAAMPMEIRARATSVAELTGKSVSRESFLRRLIHDLDRCYGELEEAGFGSLAPRWEGHFGLRDQRVRVVLFDQIVTGWARGIDRDGALLVEDDQGRTQRVIAGDVIPFYVNPAS